MRNRLLNLTLVLCLGPLAIGCGGYNLVIDEAKVLELDANRIAYTITVKNEEHSGAYCGNERFYGSAAVSVLLANEPTRDASVVKAAGGAGTFGTALPGDPNAAYGFRVLEVGEASSIYFSNVNPEGGIDLNLTPYLVITLRSSTEPSYFATHNTGTSNFGCIRYGEIQIIDLRTLSLP